MWHADGPDGARRRRRGAVAPLVVVAGALVIAGVVASRWRTDDAQCGAGFVASGARCLVGAECPSPLVRAGDGCDAPDVRVRVPAARVTIGPSDWEAEGRVAPRTIETPVFYIDAFEATVAKVAGAARDGARAASGLSREEASSYCASRGGRLPTDDEWIVAASGAGDGGTRSVPRYAWGDTGAVCRRAAWGLARGPCSSVGDGPDTVGAHPSGDGALGLHDLAGNVAEWVVDPAHRDVGIARGGSWKSELATELRIWSRLEVAPSAKDPRVGVRCAYDFPNDAH